MAEEAIGSYEIIREGEDITLRINWENAPYIPSIEDSTTCMARVIDILVEVGTVSKIIFSQKRDYEYDFSQVMLLVELAKIYKKWIKEGIEDTDLGNPSSPAFQTAVQTRKAELREILFRIMREDPLGAYVNFKRSLRKEEIKLERLHHPYLKDAETYVDFLEKKIKELAKTQLIIIAAPYLAGYHLGG